MRRKKVCKKILSVLICASIISTSGITALADEKNITQKSDQVDEMETVSETELLKEEVTDTVVETDEKETIKTESTESETEIWDATEIETELEIDNIYLSQNWDYDILDSEKIILLKQYVGSDEIVNVPKQIDIKGQPYDIMLNNAEYISDDQGEILLGVFTNNKKIKSVTFEKGVKIENNDLSYMFSGCDTLEQVNNLPSEITNLENAFENCSRLKGEITISGNPDNFENCFLNASTGKNSLIVNYTKDCLNIEQIIATQGGERTNIVKGMIVGNKSARNKCQIIFDPNGGSVSQESKDVTTGESYGALPTPVRNGYIFKGWYTDKEESHKVTPEMVYKANDSQILYAAWTYDNFTGKWNYDVNEKTKTITLHKYLDVGAEVVVPKMVKLDKIEYKIVVGKAGKRGSNGVFTNNKVISSINFEDGVKFEDNNMQFAFAGCRNLQKVTGIPTGTLDIQFAFKECISLEGIYEIPNGIKNASYAFSGCTALKEIGNLPKSATDISGIFNGCVNLLKVPDLPAKVKDVSRAFADCRSLTSVPEFPTTVKSLTYAFSGCTNLVKAPRIPKGIVDISGYLADCETIQVAPSIPSGVINMEETFLGCKSLKKAPKIPDTVSNLNYTFTGCISMEEAPKLPASLKQLSDTFRGCKSLKKAPTIPKGVTSLDWTFYNCESLTKMPTIPNGVKQMYNTFAGCTSLEIVTEIPDSVKYMRYAFSGCSSLKQVYAISNNVVDLMGTFKNCTNLRQAPDIPKSVYNMIDTFNGCVNLQGKMIINANLTDPIFEDGAYEDDDEIDGVEAYFQTFYNAGINGSGLTLDYGKNCKNISKIVASKGSGNNKVKKGKKVTIPSKMNYEVKFNGNGGKSGKASKTIKYGSFYGTLPSAKRAGYEFKGWYTKKKGGSKITSDKKIKSAKNRTVYAQWTKVKVKKVSGISLSSTTKTRMVVSTKEVKGAKGYQILYAANSSFTKGKKSLNTGLLNKTVKKLKSGRKYYVKVRAYKEDSTGKRIYGSYSKAAAVKVK